MNVEMNLKAMNIDAYCDSPVQMKEIDPRIMIKDKIKFDRIKELMEIYLDDK
jgi:hypothetical protein